MWVRRCLCVSSFGYRSRISLMSTLTMGPASRLFWTNTMLRSLRWAQSGMTGRGVCAGLDQIQFGFHWCYLVSSAAIRHFLRDIKNWYAQHIGFSLAPHNVKSFTVNEFLGYKRNPLANTLTCWHAGLLFLWHRTRFTPTCRPALTWLQRRKLTCEAQGLSVALHRDLFWSRAQGSPGVTAGQSLPCWNTSSRWCL